MADEADRSWSGWAKRQRSRFTNFASNSMMSMSAKLAKASFEWSHGERVEKYIAERINEFLQNVELDISSNGPIRGTFTDVKFKPKVIQFVYDATGGLIIHPEHTRAKKLELTINLSEMITGTVSRASLDEQFLLESGMALIRFGVDHAVFRAPGVEIILSGFHVEIHTHKTIDASMWRLSEGAPSEPSSPSQDVHQTRDSADGLSFDDIMNHVPAVAANVLSNWILKDATFELSNLSFKADLDHWPDEWPALHLNTYVDLSIGRLECRHLPFRGVRAQRYDFLNSTNTTEALKFHLMNVPFTLVIGKVVASLGQAIQVRLCNKDLQSAESSCSAIEVYVRHDDWSYYDVTFKIHYLEVFVGTNNHRLFYVSHSEASETPDGPAELLTLKLCNHLRSIEGNNVVLRSCYQEQHGGEGSKQLDKLREAHQELLKRKIEISKELDSLKDPTMMRSTMSNLNNSIKIHQLEEELHQLQDAIELSVLDQDRFFENLFWAQIEMDMPLESVCDVSFVALAEAAALLMRYSYSWTATLLDADHDGEISASEWRGALRTQFSQCVDLNNDDQVSEEEWTNCLGIPEHAELTISEQMAEITYRLKQHDDFCTFLHEMELIVDLAQPLMKGESSTSQLVEFEKISDRLLSLADSMGVSKSDVNCQYCTKEAGNMSTTALLAPSSKGRKMGCFDRLRMTENMIELQEWLSAEKLQVGRMIHQMAHEFPEAHQVSLLRGRSLIEPLGIEVKLRLKLPTINFKIMDSGDNVRLSLGYLEADCSPLHAQTEEGKKLPHDDFATNKIRVTSRGVTLELETDDTTFSMMKMPPKLVAVLAWTLRRGATSLKLREVEGFSMDFFALSESTNGIFKLSSMDSPLVVQLSEAAVIGWYKIFSGASADIMSTMKGTPGMNEVKGFTLTQLRQLSQDLMVQAIYSHWLIPRIVNKSLKISAKIHFYLQFVLSGPADRNTSDERQVDVTELTSAPSSVSFAHTLEERATDALEQALDAGACVNAMVNGFELVLHGQETFISVTKVQAAADIDLIVSFLEATVSILAFSDVNQLARPSDQLVVASPLTRKSQVERATVKLQNTLANAQDSTTVKVIIPSPYDATWAEGCIVKLAQNQMGDSAIDGPLDMINRYQMIVLLQEVQIEFKSMQLRVDGLAATAILGHHFDGGPVLQSAWFRLRQASEMTSRKASQTRVKSHEIIEAIRTIKQTELKKATATKSRKLRRIALIAAEVSIRGRVSGNQRDTWLILATKAKHPVWQMFPTLSEAKEFCRLLQMLIVAQARYGDDVVEEAKLAVDEMLEAAIDYHEIDLAQCRIALYWARKNIPDLVRCLKGIVIHKPKNPFPDAIEANLNGFGVECVNLWPCLGLLNHTHAPFYYRVNFTVKAKFLCTLFGWVLAKVVTLDNAPGASYFGVNQHSSSVAMVERENSGLSTLNQMELSVVFFGVILWLGVLMAGTAIVITDQCYDSRVFGIIGGVISWMCFLMMRCPIDEVIQPPFTNAREGLYSLVEEISAALGLSVDYSALDSFVDAGHLDAVDSIILVSTVASMSVLIINKFLTDHRVGKSVKYRRTRLHVPYAHRRLFLGAVGILHIVTGVLEGVFCIFEDQLDENAQLKTWVWPPDGGDCNKVLLLLFCLGKSAAGLLVLASGFKREFNEGNAPYRERMERSKAYARRACYFFIVMAIYLVVINLVEQSLGPSGLVMLNGSNLLNTSRPYFKKRTVWLRTGTNNPYLASSQCFRSYLHSIESVAYLLWVVAISVMYGRRVYMSSFYLRGQELADQAMKRMYMSLKKPSLARRLQPPPPPPRDAETADWVHWLKNSRVPLSVLLEVLNDEAGSKAAITMAKKGIYGWQADAALRHTESESLERFESLDLLELKNRKDSPNTITLSQCGEEDFPHLSDAAIDDIDQQLEAYLTQITPDKERWRAITSEDIQMELQRNLSHDLVYQSDDQV